MDYVCDTYGWKWEDFTPETDIENRARLDTQIKAYWNVKSMIDDILEIK